MQHREVGQHAIEVRGTEGSLPVEQRAAQVRHQHRGHRAVGGRAEVGDPHRSRQLQLPGRDEGLAEPVVARRTGDPVHRPRCPLQDERRIAAPEARQPGAGPAVMLEDLLGDAVEAGRGEQVLEVASLPAAQHGAGTSPAPSGPPST
jgi:hypothetical protein